MCALHVPSSLSWQHGVQLAHHVLLPGGTIQSILWNWHFLCRGSYVKHVHGMSMYVNMCTGWSMESYPQRPGRATYTKCTWFGVGKGVWRHFQPMQRVFLQAGLAIQNWLPFLKLYLSLERSSKFEDTEDTRTTEKEVKWPHSVQIIQDLDKKA